MEEIINERIETNNIAFSIRYALLHDKDITPSAIAKSIISKQNGGDNFKGEKLDFADRGMNSDNFIEKSNKPIKK